jgi:hypothetical protein
VPARLATVIGAPALIQQESDHRHRLLRARRERPRRRAAEKWDEVPPPHGAYPTCPVRPTGGGSELILPPGQRIFGRDPQVYSTTHSLVLRTNHQRARGSCTRANTGGAQRFEANSATSAAQTST